MRTTVSLNCQLHENNYVIIVIYKRATNPATVLHLCMCYQLSKYPFKSIRIMLEEIPTTYVINASHSKKFSSLMGPAIIPSGGFRVSSETCTK